MKRPLIVFLICVLLSLQSKAQEDIRFQNVTVADGLSMGSITAVQKDSMGFVWIATAEGLHRYDGKYFKIFKHSSSDPSSLSDSYIRCMKVVGNDLFIGNNSGIVDVLDLTTYEAKHLYPSRIDPSFDFPILSLEYFKENLVIGTDGGGMWSYSPEFKQLQRFDLKHSKNAIIPCMKTYGNSLFYAMDDTLFSTDLRTREALFTAPLSYISSFALSEQGIYLGGPGGVYFKTFITDELMELEMPEKKRRVKIVTDIKVNGTDVWIGTEGGLVHYKLNKMKHYEADATAPFSLVNNKISTLYLDDRNSLWVGTIAGVSYYSPTLKKFEVRQNFIYKGESYNNNIYYIYIAKDSNIWLGSLTGGLIKMDQDHKIIDGYPIIRDEDVETKAIRCIYEDNLGNFWIGTRDEGLFLFDESKRSFTHVKGKEGNRISSKIIRSLFEDSKGRFWIGTQNGLDLYDREKDLAYNYVAEPKYPANNSVYQITEDKKTGNLVVGSFRGGVQIFNPETKRFISLKHHQDDSSSIGNNNVMCLEWINEDTVLIGTYGGGMDILDIRTKRATHVTEDQGLINNAVYGILYNGNGDVWMSTNNGICTYNMYTGDVIGFKTIHYLQNTEYNEGAFARSPSGYFYFGGISGINYFKPDNIDYRTKAPSILITDIRGELKNKKDQLTLSFLNSRLELDFMALYFDNPNGVNYKYKMEGYDQDWITPKYSNTASYPRLEPGHYTFKVYAVDEFGKWTSNTLELNVYVVPPVWKRWWFIALGVLLLLVVLFLIFRVRTRAIERSYKHQLVDSELRALRSQMNPHFIFNSLNSIQYFILKKQPQEAYTYLSKFASLMRKILQNSRLKYISIKDEAEWLDLYLEMEKLRMDNDLHFDIDTSGISNIEAIHIPTMLIQPYVENGIIHGLLSKEGDKNISVRFKEGTDHIECVVEDNGIGREASRKLNEKRTRKHDSAGMALTKTRLKILSEGKGDFDVRIDDLNEEGKASGTRVTILIPIIDADEKD